MPNSHALPGFVFHTCPTAAAAAATKAAAERGTYQTSSTLPGSPLYMSRGSSSSSSGAAAASAAAEHGTCQTPAIKIPHQTPSPNSAATLLPYNMMC
jgi:hypothetical protein